jgi:hypothetical protein
VGGPGVVVVGSWRSSMAPMKEARPIAVSKRLDFILRVLLKSTVDSIQKLEPRRSGVGEA